MLVTNVIIVPHFDALGDYIGEAYAQMLNYVKPLLPSDCSAVPLPEDTDLSKFWYVHEGAVGSPEETWRAIPKETDPAVLAASDSHDYFIKPSESLRARELKEVFSKAEASGAYVVRQEGDFLRLVKADKD